MLKFFFKNNYLGFLLGLISISALYFVSLYNYILYHSLVELFSIVIAFAIFIIAWNAKKFLDNCYLLFIGIAYFFVAVLDLFHTLAYSGMNVFMNYPEANLATQLWIAARYVQSISLILALFFITRRLNYKMQFTSYLAASILIFLSIFYWKIFPACFIEGSGLTLFKTLSEYIICFILAAAIFFLHLYRKEFNKKVFILIVSSLFINIVSELSFTLYSDVYGLFNQLGHFLKLTSFFLIYKAIVETGFSQPFRLFFFKLKQREKDLKESEEKYHSLYSFMSEGAALHEIINDELGRPIDYVIIDVNDAFETILGLKRNHVIGKKASEVYKTHIAPYISIYAEVVNTGKPKKFETYFPAMKKYFLISVFSPSRGKFATIFSDITEQKKIEKEIESLSRFTLDNPNPVIRINDKNSVIFSNKPAKNLLNQLDKDKKDKLLKFFRDSTTDLNGKKNTEMKRNEIKIGKSIYEFNVLYVEQFNYYNISGMEITDRKKAERFAKRLVKEKTLNEQRSKLARELHDTVTQTLFSANLTAEVIPKLWEKNPEIVLDKLEELKKLNNSALMEMRVLLYELRPSALKNEDLGSLLEELVESVSVRSNTPIELIIKAEHKYPPKIEMGYYRIAQEALNNIIKHSNASKASLILEILPEKLYMHVLDNGRGFKNKKNTSTNLGLAIMKERAKIIGASIDIKSLPGKGTSITVIYSKKQKIDNRS